MAALIKDRNTPSRAGDKLSLPVATSVLIFAGSIVMLNATGYATPGATATGQVAAGRAAEQVDNSAGLDGAVNVDVEPGVFQFANSAAADAITIAEVGDTCYIVDDQTVAKTDGTGTRSAAGKVVGVDSDGVWVRMGL
jgi:hypothetical protein